MENRSFTQPPNFNFNTPLDENRPPKPDNNLVLAIIATVIGLSTCNFCCIATILGIVAIIFSNQVDTKYNYGDYFGAESAAKNAKILSFISLGLFGLNIIWWIVQLVTFGTGEFMHQYQEALEQMSNR